MNFIFNLKFLLLPNIKNHVKKDKFKFIKFLLIN